MGENGQIQVMLLTSRETHRWVIPKGWPIKGLKPAEVAAREAYEEAGLAGRIIGKRRIGMFEYQKQLPGGPVLCEVRVFLLWVNGQSRKWPEKTQRETRWFDPAEAAALVDEDGLAEIIESAVTAKRLRRFRPSPLPATTPAHARQIRASCRRQRAGWRAQIQEPRQTIRRLQSQCLPPPPD